ncbi:UNVERIFIED_CONTAM: hypothetical protein Scaly_0593800 [Sesamum calycinum]|uniref:Uncharacterized protein n=1 Tax=Sesamum calycinum TaxID=2727403 RepID=A0AAW2RSD5_9LAMI
MGRRIWEETDWAWAEEEGEGEGKGGSGHRGGGERGGRWRISEQEREEAAVMEGKKWRRQRTAEIAQWTERDQIGSGAILSALSNTLFDVYCSDSYTAKSLWDELDWKYNTIEKGLEKYFVSKFMQYQMIENRSVAEQIHEIINLEHALADAETKLPEKFWSCP